MCAKGNLGVPLWLWMGWGWAAGGAGAALEWPLWLHPRAAGELELHYVLYYEPPSPVDGMKYRCASTHPFLFSFMCFN